MSQADTMVDQQAQPSDIRAFVTAHARFVWRSLRFLGVAPSDLPDVSQEVFLVVVRKLGSFEGRSTQRSWLYGVCINAARAYRRRAHRRYEVPCERIPEEVTNATPEVACRLREDQELLAWALDRARPIIVDGISNTAFQRLVVVPSTPIRQGEASPKHCFFIC